MKYVIILFLLVISMYPLSYAKYNWNEGNKLGAIGTIILAAAAIAIPSMMLFFR